jgi:hypothetical protein
MPPLPIPPIPPIEGLEPVADLVAGVMNEVLPRALGAAGTLGPLASREAGLQMRLQALEHRRSQGRASGNEVAEIDQLRDQLVDVRRRRKTVEKQLERDMEAFGNRFERGPGKDFERRMEAWGEEYGKRMEKWGEEYGRHMERWGEEYGKQWERWGEDLDWRLREPRVRQDRVVPRRPEQPRPPAQPRRPERPRRTD